MGMFKTLLRTGIATKVINEARKPKNQEKAKQLFQQAKDKVTGDKNAPPPAQDRTTTTVEQDGKPRTR